MHIFFQNNQYIGSYYFTRSTDDPVARYGVINENNSGGLDNLDIKFKANVCFHHVSGPSGTMCSMQSVWNGMAKLTNFWNV